MPRLAMSRIAQHNLTRRSSYRRKHRTVRIAHDRHPDERDLGSPERIDLSTALMYDRIKILRSSDVDRSSAALEYIAKDERVDFLTSFERGDVEACDPRYERRRHRGTLCVGLHSSAL